MKLRRKVIAIMLLAAMLVGSETRRTSAQAAPPDLRMLMNLDLFEPRPSNDVKGAAAPAAPPAEDSMLDQIRTLDAMGYLGNHANAYGTAAGRSDVPAPRAATGGAPAPAPSSQPSYDKGPQP